MTDDARLAVEGLAAWSAWVPFDEALATAPRKPGVYLAREGTIGPVVYVGMAGERDGGGKGEPQGIRGRLARYKSGKAIASGLGEAVFDRALADAAWLRERLAEAEAGTPVRAAGWGKLAFLRADLHVCWAETTNRATALALEDRCEQAFPLDALWNRKRTRR